MMNIERNLNLALQKMHFNELDVSIRLMIDVIREQQKQIEELKAKETNNG